MKFEGPPQSQQLIPEDELKEMHMKGRAMRVDETPEEYNAEREKSWAEKQNSEQEDSKNQENQEVEQQIESSLDTVSDSEVVKVYDRSGKFVFSGSPDQLMIFWKNKDYGTTIEDIGGISDEKERSILRFGPADGRGFVDRKRIGGLFQRLESKVAIREQAAKDAQELNKLREQLGIPKQDIQGDNLITPEQNQQRNYEGIEDKDFEEFRVKNGETDEGLSWWYEYENAAAKKLKKFGEFEWGKERLYFDIPIDNMEELRNLVFEVAKSEKIPIAFKHLDVQKTHQANLKPDSEATRFVANFASVEDAKRFYQELQRQKKYREIESDRNLDYSGYNIDGVAHYASGYREKRGPLKHIIRTAQRNSDNTYSYYSTDGSKQITIAEEQYKKFVNQFKAMPDPEETWKKTTH